MYKNQTRLKTSVWNFSIKSNSVLLITQNDGQNWHESETNGRRSLAFIPIMTILCILFIFQVSTLLLSVYSFPIQLMHVANVTERVMTEPRL